MSRDLKHRFHPVLAPLEGRQLLAARFTSALARGMLAVRDGKELGSNPAITAAAEGGAERPTLHAERAGVAPQAKFLRPRAPVRKAAAHLRRQFPQRTAALPIPRFPAAIPASSPAPTATPTPIPIPAPVPTPAPPPGAASLPSGILSATEQAVVDLTNGQRVANGLAPLSVNTRLVQAAQLQAGNMAQFDQMAHELPGAAQPTLVSRADAVGYNYAKLGENVAYNFAGPSEVISGWMNSPGHRANILDPGFTEIGVGIAYNSAGQPYYCQVFGRSA